jgi:uncharacterized repeat protein (TIGR01451 family)
MITPRYTLKTLIATFLLVGLTTSAFATTYKVDTLPQTPDIYGTTLPTMAIKINSRGEVAGSTSVGESGSGSVYWNVAGQITNLTPGDSPYYSTAGITQTGTVVYSDVNYGGAFYAWNAGTLTSLGTGYAYAVNGKGQIQGSFSGVIGLWTNGVITALPLPTGSTYAYATSINNNGDVVGAAYFSDTKSNRAVIWRNGTIQEIGTLAGDVSSTANAINDAGQVVGYSVSSSYKWRAFLWDNGVISDLSLATDAVSFALGINNAGQIVGGAAAPGSANNHPFVWQNGVRTDLSSLVGDANCSAYDINDSGALVANCTGNVISGPKAFRLTPVVDSAADLSVNFSATPTPATVGLPFVYTTTITNIGSAITANATLTQNLPASGFTIDSITSSKGSCNGSNVITCAFGDLAPGAGAVVTVTAIPLPIVGVADYFNANVVVATSSPDINAVNNTASLHFAVFQNNAALSVHSVNSQTTAKKGGNITYTWNVSNGGPLNASNVVLTDTLPSSLSFVSATTTLGTCSGTTTIKCDLGNYQYSGITVTIVAKAKVSGTIINSATVTSSTPDTYLGDNKASVSTKVR